MSEQHLDALSITARLLECFGLCRCPSNIAGGLVEAAWDSAHRRPRTALRFEGAGAAIACPGSVVDCLSIAGQLAGRHQNLAGRADVNVALFVEGEVFPAEGPVLSLRLVIDRDMRRYPGLVDQPVEVSTRTVGRISSKQFGLDGEALLGAFDHSPGRANLGLADGAGRLDIHDDADLHVDQIVVRIAEKRRAPQGAGPLRGRIGRGHKLRLDFARRPECRVIKRGQILLRPSARRLGGKWRLSTRCGDLGSIAVFHCAPRIDRCLLASATIRLASTAKPLPPTRPASIQAPTTRSKMLRKMPQSQKRSLRARENTE